MKSVKEYIACLYSGMCAVVLVYVFFSILWILLFDRVMKLFFSSPDTLMQVTLTKDWLFVAVSSLLLFFLLRRFVNRLSEIHQRERQLPPPMLTSIADSSTDAIFAKDKDGRYLLVNNAAARFIGKPAEVILGYDDRAVFPPEQAEELMDIGRRVIMAGQIETNEETLQTAIGTRVFLATKGPLYDAQGEVFGIFGISRDITERKQAEAQLKRNEEQLHLLIDHSPAALAMFDHDMHYLIVSRRWIEDYGLGESDIIGMSHYDVFPEIGADLKAIYQRGLSGEILASDSYPFERYDGRVQWLRWEIRPWFQVDGNVGGIVIFTEDITERVNSEMEIRLRNEELERFNLASVGRELDMIALKGRVNALSVELGREPPFDLSIFGISNAENRQ